MKGFFLSAAVLYAVMMFFAVPVFGDVSNRGTAVSSGTGASISSYQILFEAGNGEPPEIYSVSIGNSLERIPVAPVRDGWDFTGWYDEGGELFNFRQRITSDRVLVAGWRMSAGRGFSETIGGIDIDTVFVPAVRSFPMGVDDGAEGRTEHDFLISTTEVDWRLWIRVYDWAVRGTAGEGAGAYEFSGGGRPGFLAGAGLKRSERDLQPAVGISYADALIWCNALTEWSNAEGGSELETVYNYGGKPVRSSYDVYKIETDENESAADGYRLPTEAEWELAARWRNDDYNTIEGPALPWFTRGDSASGAINGLHDFFATRKVAWDYRADLSGDTHPVASTGFRGYSSTGLGQANDLGLYDMSGNASEWVFSGSGADALRKGGSILEADADLIMIGASSAGSPPDLRICGFRFVRTTADGR